MRKRTTTKDSEKKGERATGGQQTNNTNSSGFAKQPAIPGDCRWGHGYKKNEDGGGGKLRSMCDETVRLGETKKSLTNEEETGAVRKLSKGERTRREEQTG